MGLFHRRDDPPAEVVAQLPKGERIVSWADVEGGAAVLATPSGLWWPDSDGLRRIGWHYVNRAVWQDDMLRVVEAEIVDELLLIDRPEIAVRLIKPRDLPATVRKRVEKTVVRSQVDPVAGGTARFVARHVPGEDGVQWWARLEPDTPDTAQVRSAVSARLTSLRAEWEAQSGSVQRW